MMIGCRKIENALITSKAYHRSSAESCLVEISINSCRFSLKIKQNDDIEKFLCCKFTKFMTRRAETFIILRRKPVDVPFHKYENNILTKKRRDLI